MITQAKKIIQKPIQKLNFIIQISTPTDLKPTIVIQAMSKEYDALI